MNPGSLDSEVHTAPHLSRRVFESKLVTTLPLRVAKSVSFSKTTVKYKEGQDGSQLA